MGCEDMTEYDEIGDLGSTSGAKQSTFLSKGVS